jgi:hypothetical protein
MAFDALTLRSRVGAGKFDIVAAGLAVLVDPQWVQKAHDALVRAHRALR